MADNERPADPTAASGAAPQPAGAASAAPDAAQAPDVPQDPQSQRIAQLEAQLEFSTTRARETQERLKDEHERLLRLGAEFDNYRKRAMKEKDDARKFAVESLLKDFLPVADNLERALEHADQHDPKQVLEGVKLVQKMFEGALQKHGLSAFSALGQAFDPNLHEALMQEESDQPAGTVVREMARGYRLHERLVRPAAVVVARARTAAETPSENPGGANGSL